MGTLGCDGHPGRGPWCGKKQLANSNWQLAFVSALHSSVYRYFTDNLDFKKNKQKVPHSYSRALPIHAKSGRAREPENARSLTEFGMTIQRKVTLRLKSI